MSDTRWPKRMIVPTLGVASSAFTAGEVAAAHLWPWVGAWLFAAVMWAWALKETIITHTMVERAAQFKRGRK